MAETAELVFVTSIYGQGYTPFLAPHLYSVHRCHPRSSHVVLWQDLPEQEIRLLSVAFPHCRFIRIEEPMPGGPHQRLARKVGSWRSACALYSEQPLCFIDCDALLVKPIDQFLGSGADAVFTWKDEPWPLNLGILLVKNGRIGELVLGEWARRTHEIVADPQQFRTALTISGDGSQHAFRQMIGFVNYDGMIRRLIAGVELTFQGVPCRLLNETRSVPISDDTHVIHYKSGWHQILLNGTGFSASRSRAACVPMYQFWQDTQTQATQSLVRTFVMNACAAHAPAFEHALSPYEERGVIHSEMLAVCAVCDELKVEVILESGRCRGQSTLMLARYFQDRPVEIVSVELHRDEHAAFTERRLKGFSHVRLLYGNSQVVIPRLARRLRGRRWALLVDGPKGPDAIALVRRTLAAAPEALAVFFHDAKRSSPIRELLPGVFQRAFFTDDEDYVKTYVYLDTECQPQPGQAITMHTWRPYRTGTTAMLSYGPTMAVAFPRGSEGRRCALTSHEWLSTLCTDGVRSRIRTARQWATQRWSRA